MTQTKETVGRAPTEPKLQRPIVDMGFGTRLLTTGPAHKLLPAERVQLQSAVDQLRKITKPNVNDQMNLFFYEAMLHKDAGQTANPHFAKLSSVCLAFLAQTNNISVTSLLALPEDEEKAEMRRTIQSLDETIAGLQEGGRRMHEEIQGFTARQVELAEEIEQTTRRNQELMVELENSQAQVVAYENTLQDMEKFCDASETAQKEMKALLDLTTEENTRLLVAAAPSPAADDSKMTQMSIAQAAQEETIRNQAATIERLTVDNESVRRSAGELSEKLNTSFQERKKLEDQIAGLGLAAGDVLRNATLVISTSPGEPETVSRVRSELMKEMSGRFKLMRHLFGSLEGKCIPVQQVGELLGDDIITRVLYERVLQELEDGSIN